MIKLYRFLIPFAAIGVLFMVAGFILSDDRFIYFGIVWFIIALVVFLGYKAKRP